MTGHNPKPVFIFCTSHFFYTNYCEENYMRPVSKYGNSCKDCKAGYYTVTFMLVCPPPIVQPTWFYIIKIWTCELQYYWIKDEKQD